MSTTRKALFAANRMNTLLSTVAVHVQNTPTVMGQIAHLATMDIIDMVKFGMMILDAMNVPTIHIVLQDTNVKTDSVFLAQQMGHQHVQRVQAKRRTLTELNVFAVSQQQTVTETANVRTMNA